MGSVVACGWLAEGSKPQGGEGVVDCRAAGLANIKKGIDIIFVE